MSDLISRQAAIDALMAWEEDYIWDEECIKHRGEPHWVAPSDVIEQLPSVQPEAKPPKWVAEDRYIKNRFAVFPHCPQCNEDVTTGQCYCMICGQHIDWSEDDG